MVRVARRRFPARPRRKLGRRAPRRAAAVRPALAKAIKQVMTKTSETKYQLATVYSLANVPSSITANGPTGFAMPAIGQGTGIFQREGANISNVRGRTLVHLSFRPSPLGGTAEAVDCYVRFFYGTSKSIRAAAEWVGILNDTLLAREDGQSQDFGTGSPSTVLQQSLLSVQRKFWNLKTKTVRLNKNNGYLNGSAAPGMTTPNAHTSALTVSLPYSHKGTVSYPGVSGVANQFFPSNFAPVWWACVYTVDGDVVPSNMVCMTATTECYWKDI